MRKTNKKCNIDRFGNSSLWTKFSAESHAIRAKLARFGFIDRPSLAVGRFFSLPTILLLEPCVPTFAEVIYVLLNFFSLNKRIN